MKKVLIIDDEKMARELLKSFLERLRPDYVVLELCATLTEGVKSIHKNSPDLVFLDIEMPNHSGLEILDFFREDQISFEIIFVTAYNKYAIQAFKLAAVDYLLKPLELEDLSNALSLFEKRIQRVNINEVRGNFENNRTMRLAISTATTTYYISLDEILFFKGEGAYTVVYLKNQQQIVSSRGLKSYEDLLEDIPVFFRCHKSYIVNTEFIVEFSKSDGGKLKLQGDHIISVSPEKSFELVQLIPVLNRK